MCKMIDIRAMRIDDYDRVYEMWVNTPGVGLSGADSREGITGYLKRNPGLSFICSQDEKIVGTILCGHDGRRGYIHHTCVLSEYRGMGIGRALVEKALTGLRTRGIDRCHLFVFCDNETGNSFWSGTGWQKRIDLFVYSRDT